MPSKQELGERIKRFRLERNLTLKEVELKAKVSAMRDDPGWARVRPPHQSLPDEAAAPLVRALSAM